MTTEKTTDYVSGDDPVPVGTAVEYFGSLSPGRYTITAHKDPMAHPYRNAELVQGAAHPCQDDEALKDVYPDGVAYELWPVGVSRKFGNSHLSVNFVRRTSFRLLHAEGNKG